MFVNGTRRTYLALAILAAFIFLTPHPVVAADSAAPARPNLRPDMNAPLPAGPFASWPADVRDTAVRGLTSRCIFMAAMSLDAYRGPKEAGGLIVSAILGTCLSMMMPDDWPQQLATRAQIVSAYKAAKRIDPNVPDPNAVGQMIATAMHKLDAPPQDMTQFVHNLQKADSGCLLLQASTFTPDGMRRLFGAQDAQFSDKAGADASSANTPIVQVRAYDFGGISPKFQNGTASMQMVGKPGSQDAWVNFILSPNALPITGLTRDQVESALDAKLTFVAVQPRPPHLEDLHLPENPSYYMLDRQTALCHFQIRVHFQDEHMDSIYLDQSRP